MTEDDFIGSSYVFCRCLPLWSSKGFHAEPIGKFTLMEGGRLAGYTHPNEALWGIEDGSLVFKSQTGHPNNLFRERDGNGILYGRQNMIGWHPIGLCLVPDVTIPPETKTVVVVASCQRFHQRTLPSVIPQLKAAGFETSEIKVVINGSSGPLRFECNDGIDCLYTPHDAYEFSAYYEAIAWDFDYALVTGDTATIHPGCKDRLRNLNGACDWEGFPALTNCHLGVGVASKRYLERIRPDLERNDRQTKVDNINFERMGGIWRFAERAIMSIQPDAMETPTLQLVEGGVPRRSFYMGGLEVSRHVNWGSVDRGDHQLL